MSAYAPDPMMGPPPPGLGLSPDPGMMGPPPGMMGAPPPEPTPAPDGPSLLQQAIELLKAYADQETEQEDSAAALDFAGKIAKLLAKQAKEADTALGVGPQQRFLRRANSG